MLIYGLDFTSSPSQRKPITCACCELQDAILRVKTCLKMPTFAEFEAFLRTDGPWLAALDFPECSLISSFSHQTKTEMLLLLA